MPTIHLERVIAAPLERSFRLDGRPGGLWPPHPWCCGRLGGGFVGTCRGGRTGGDRSRHVVSWEEIGQAYDRPNSYSYLIIGSFPPFDHDGGNTDFRTPRRPYA